MVNGEWRMVNMEESAGSGGAEGRIELDNSRFPSHFASLVVGASKCLAEIAPE